MFPILFEFGAITVFSLWLFVAVGFACGSFLFTKLSKRYRIKLSVIGDNAFALFFWTLLISRAAFIVTHADFYFYNFSFGDFWDLFALWDKGLSFWGAILAWFAGIIYLLNKAQTDYQSKWRLLDIIIPSCLFGMIFGDIGTFLEGINYGSPTEMPWGMAFRNANVRYISAIHPTQLYSAIYSGFIVLTLVYLLKKLRGDLPGFVTEAGIFLFSLFRFFEEFFRGDETIKILGIRMPFILTGIGVGISLYWIIQRYTNKTGTDPDRILQNTVKAISKKIGLLMKPNSAKISATLNPLQNQTT